MICLIWLNRISLLVIKQKHEACRLSKGTGFLQIPPERLVSFQLGHDEFRVIGQEVSKDNGISTCSRHWTWKLLVVATEASAIVLAIFLPEEHCATETVRSFKNSNLNRRTYSL